MNPTDEATAASASQTRGRPSIERPRVKIIHMPTPTITAVPALVRATDGAREMWASR